MVTSGFESKTARRTTFMHFLPLPHQKSDEKVDRIDVSVARRDSTPHVQANNFDVEASAKPRRDCDDDEG